MRDITIIGGGVIGCLTARALSKYKLDICLLERRHDVASETSKANSAIVHAGFDAKSGTNKAKYNVLGNAMMERVCEELDVHFKRNGSMLLTFDAEKAETLAEILTRGKTNGVPGLSLLTGDEARALEPNISKEVVAVLRAETGGIVCPYMLTHNAARNAAENGVDIRRGVNAEAVEWKNGHFVIHTNEGDVETRYILNAAGVHADDVARMAGDSGISIRARRGEYLLMDKKAGGFVSHTIFQTPTKMGKGILVTPTVDGNLLVGPSAMDSDDKNDVDTTREGLDAVTAGAMLSVPTLNPRDVITSFTGLRAVSDNDDFIIGFSEAVPNLLHAAGMQSPGLSAAPAVAAALADMLVERIGGAALNPNYNPRVAKSPRILEITPEELHALIQANPAYGNIICRCETVSEGEIVASIQNAAGARDIDGVKRRTRAGMGRCQGGFCMPRVLDILVRETGVPYTEIVKNENGSYILTADTKGGAAE